VTVGEKENRTPSYLSLPVRVSNKRACLSARPKSQQSTVNVTLFSVLPLLLLVPSEPRVTNYESLDVLAHGQQEPHEPAERGGQDGVAGKASGAPHGAGELAVTETRCPAEGYADEDLNDKPHLFSFFLPSCWGNA